MKHNIAALVVLAVLGVSCASGAGVEKSAGSSFTTPGAAAATTAPEQPSEEPSEEPTEEPVDGPKQFSFADTATVTRDGEPSMEIVITRPKFYKREPGDYGSKPEESVFAVFTISAKAVEQADINPFDFYVRDDDGTHRELAFVTEFKPQLNAVTLNPREKVKGNVTFDLPKKHGTLVYAPATTALAEWKF